MNKVMMCILAGLSILATGCKNIDENGTALTGTDWRLAAWSVSSLEPTQFTITAAFDDTQLSGTSAVNSYSGTYAATTSGDFTVGALQSTEMAGSEEAMRAEEIYFALLEQAGKYTVNATTLILLGPGNNELLVFEKR